MEDKVTKVPQKAAAHLLLVTQRKRGKTSWMRAGLTKEPCLTQHGDKLKGLSLIHTS